MYDNNNNSSDGKCYTDNASNKQWYNYSDTGDNELKMTEMMMRMITMMTIMVEDDNDELLSLSLLSSLSS